MCRFSWFFVVVRLFVQKKKKNKKYKIQNKQITWLCYIRKLLVKEMLNDQFYVIIYLVSFHFVSFMFLLVNVIAFLCLSTGRIFVVRQCTQTYIPSIFCAIYRERQNDIYERSFLFHCIPSSFSPRDLLNKTIEKMHSFRISIHFIIICLSAFYPPNKT